MYNKDRTLEVMDATLEGRYLWEEGIRVTKIGVLCTQVVASLRPSMFWVVLMLTNETKHLHSSTRPTSIDLDGLCAPDEVKCHRVINWEKTSSST